MTHSILIVDDNPVIRRTLRSCFLQSVDWQVCGEAANGRDAVEKAQHLKPDLIILDLSMPVMNGLQAARELKRMGATVVVVGRDPARLDDIRREIGADTLRADLQLVSEARRAAGLGRLHG